MPRSPRPGTLRTQRGSRPTRAGRTPARGEGSGEMALQSAPPMLVVAEIAPATMVGDGPSAGRRCAMIRLGGCNLACTWCDVPFSWDGGRFDLGVEMPRRLVRNIVEEALTDAPQLVLLTGGEPLLQQRS